MVTKQIRSLQHKVVKKAVLLRTCKRFRSKENSVLVAGKKPVQELAKHFSPSIVFFTKKAPLLKGKEMYEVEPSVLKKITGFIQPDGLAAIFSKPVAPLSFASSLLVLDGVRDPGNLGTLFRSALGLGWKEIALVDCTDPWGEKALRASMGAVFHLAHEGKTREELIKEIQKKPLPCYVGDPKGVDLEKVICKKPLALILGSEATGIEPSLYPKAIGLSLPMHPATESYNVAVAGSIFLYVLR